LDNLPQGAFRQREITPKDAKRRIERARAKNRLLCLSGDDLPAPYHKRALDNHTDQRRVLNKHFGIAIEIKDFFDHYGDDSDPGYSILSLCLAKVKGRNRLLVVTCAYTLDEKRGRGGRPLLTVGPSSIKFHLYESIPQSA
jgi:hypothetical protein